MKISEVVDKLIDFDRQVMSETFGYFLDQESTEPFNKRIHAIIVLEEINVLTSYCSRLIIGHKLPTESLVQSLIGDILSEISNLSILEYAPTYPKSSKELESELLTGLEIIRSDASVETDGFIQKWSDVLLYRQTLDNPPKWAKSLFENAKSEVSNKFLRDYGIDIDYLTTLSLVFENLEDQDKNMGKNLSDPRNVDAEVITKYKQFVWDEARFLTSDLEELIKSPPFFIKLGAQYSLLYLPSYSYIIDSYKFQQFLAINKKHGNLKGDASELVIKDFLTEKSIEFDYQVITFPQKNKQDHADWCRIGKKIKNSNETYDLFSKLGEADKKECEIDIIARIQDILLIGEIKITTSYDNVCQYYYFGTDKKTAEQVRLKAFYSWFSKNIDIVERLLKLPPLNGVKKCIPIFITNQNGDIIRDNDGILKLVPLDVMFTEHFKKTVDEFGTTQVIT